MIKNLKLRKDEMIFLGALGLMLVFSQLQVSFFENAIANEMLQNSITRFGIGFAFIYLLFRSGYQTQLKFPFNKRFLIILLPALFIAINNYPISAYLNDRISRTEPTYTIFLFGLVSISVALVEELIFRVLILSVLLQTLSKSKKNLLLAIVLQAFIFGVFHVFNFFTGMGIQNVILQMGYSFLLGMLWAVLYLRTKNIWLIILIHTLYNFFGQVAFEVGTVSNRYDTITIVATIVVSIVTMFYAIYIYKNLPVQPLEEEQEEESVQ